jgi:predicted ATPase
VGKTSLALQVAHELSEALSAGSAQDFADGIFFISLAPISDPTLIIPTIAQILGVTESPNRLLLDTLKEFLRNKRTLLLLDNFEQIISAAPLLSELLSGCAELRMLVTSRESLRLRGEHEFPLSPLALPDLPSVERLSQSPSIALFMQRAQAIQPDFQLTNENAAAVAEVCARLDGLPLALELAAARIKLLPPKTMLARLQESPLQLLTSGARDMPARQQTLRNTVQWSYDLLGNEEQRTFRWLSVFVGGCTLEAAQFAAGPPASIDILESLVSKSLLRQTESEGTPRLTMLETIREFGLEQLSHAHEMDSARGAHTSYYLSFASRKRFDGRRPESVAPTIGPRAGQPASSTPLGDGTSRSRHRATHGRRAAAILVQARALERRSALAGRIAGNGLRGDAEPAHPGKGAI